MKFLYGKFLQFLYEQYPKESLQKELRNLFQPNTGENK